MTTTAEDEKCLSIFEIQNGRFFLTLYRAVLCSNQKVNQSLNFITTQIILKEFNLA
jgi:hypothetical protein